MTWHTLVLLSLCSRHHRWRALSAPATAHQRESGEAAVQGQRRRRLQHGRQWLVQPGGAPGLRGGADRRLPPGRAPRLCAPVRLGEQGQRQHRHTVHGAAQDQPRRHCPEPGSKPVYHKADGNVCSVVSAQGTLTEFHLSHARNTYSYSTAKKLSPVILK